MSIQTDDQTCLFLYFSICTIHVCTKCFLFSNSSFPKCEKMLCLNVDILLTNCGYFTPSATLSRSLFSPVLPLSLGTRVVTVSSSSHPRSCSSSTPVWRRSSTLSSCVRRSPPSWTVWQRTRLSLNTWSLPERSCWSDSSKR